jgi:peptidoglycan/xylan/chitin deacetylase (PgdA/CDA1 family)
MLRHGPPEGGRVYLTFDDGPDPRWTPRVLELLAAAGARAVFFVIGRRARAHPALLRRMLEEGHALGNHTYTHAHPWLLRDAAARREVRDGADAIADACAVQPAFFRPPHGRVRRCMTEQAQADNQQTVLWSRSAIDWGLLGYAAAVARRLGAAEAGDILLMHDGARGPNRPDSTCAALPGFLALLPGRGLSAAPLPATGGSAQSARVQHPTRVGPAHP